MVIFHSYVSLPEGSINPIITNPPASSAHVMVNDPDPPKIELPSPARSSAAIAPRPGSDRRRNGKEILRTPK